LDGVVGVQVLKGWKSSWTTHPDKAVVVIATARATANRFFFIEFTSSLRLVLTRGELPEEIGPGQIDEFVAAPAEHRFEHEEAEAGHLL
jgi:hypothetical protein